MPPPPPTFLMTLAVLSYKLLFHSDRELNVVSLVFCVACAWSVAQLYGVYWAKDMGSFDGSGTDTSGMGNMDIYSRMVWEWILRIAKFLGEVSAQGIHFGCGFFSMSPEGRESCFEWGNWVRNTCGASQ